jgi:two-component system, LytTR family, response regulator LytT
MNILLIEDEVSISEFIEQKVTEILKEETNIDKAYTLNDGIEKANQNKYDICLLDLNLNNENGFKLLEIISEREFETIIISENTENALKAFEYSVLDFIPKPFDQERLQQAFDKYFKKHNQQVSEKEYLSTRKSGKNFVLEVDNIEMFKAADIYVEAHLRNGQKELLDRTMEQLEQLFKNKFLRIHRSYLVDMKEITEFYHAGGGSYRLQLKNGKELPVSRSRYKMVQGLFN